MNAVKFFVFFVFLAGCNPISPVADSVERSSDAGRAQKSDSGTADENESSSLNGNGVDENDSGYPDTLDAGHTDAGTLIDGTIEFADAGDFAPNEELENDGGTMDDLEIPAALTSILDDIPGWGAGTLGGRNGRLYTVSGLHDSGPGSLREALESPDPLWIVFAPDVNGILHMQNSISVQSYKTIDARGHNITLRATGDWVGGLRIGDANQPGVEHIVILNLKFDGQWPDFTEDGEGADGINIRNGSHHIWIHQCSFTNWVDGAIDAKMDAGFPIPHHITISKNFFTKTHQPLAVAIDHLTFARNHCLDVTKRCIQLNNGGRGHMVNNVVEDWRAASIVAPKDGAQLLVDHNLFKPGPDCDAVGTQLKEDTDEYGHWQNEKNHWRLSWGWVAFKKFTSVDDGWFASTREAYPPTECGVFDYDCWDELFATVVSEAGAQH